MWSCALAILAVATLATGDELPGVGGNFPAGARALLEPRLAASALRLARIEKELGELKQRIGDAKKVDPEGFINDLNDRIDHVEAVNDHCDSSKEIRCGRDTLECVNSLLLCDGQKDCHNGWDENDKTCSAGPAKSGNTFTGTATWVSCQNRHDHPIKVTLTGTYKAKFFGARLGVRGTVSIDFVDDDNADHRDFEVKGYYVYGFKKLVLVPRTIDYAHQEAFRQHLGVVCDFVHGNDRTAECVLTHEGSKHVCAKFHATLQE
jgi:hypothetical protein